MPSYGIRCWRFLPRSVPAPGCCFGAAFWCTVPRLPPACGSAWKRNFPCTLNTPPAALWKKRCARPAVCKPLFSAQISPKSNALREDAKYRPRPVSAFFQRAVFIFPAAGRRVPSLQRRSFYSRFPYKRAKDIILIIQKQIVGIQIAHIDIAAHQVLTAAGLHILGGQLVGSHIFGENPHTFQ